MSHNCRTHCPSHARLPWLFDLLAGLAVLAGVYWLAGRAAPAVGSAASSALRWLVAVGVLVVAAVVLAVGVRVWLNRRARAKWAMVKREAQAAAPPPERAEPAALPPRSRELEAAPIRVDAFRVESQRDVA